MKIYVMTTAQIAQAFGVTNSAVTNWALPIAEIRGKTNCYDIRDAIRYNLTRHLKQTELKKGDTKEEEEVLLMRARREKLELEIATIKGDLIPADVVEDVWSDQLGYFKSSINSMPAKTGREICERFGITDQVTVEHILTRGRDEALARMSEYDAGEYMRRAGASVARIKEELDAVEQAAIEQKAPGRKKRGH